MVLTHRMTCFQGEHSVIVNVGFQVMEPFSSKVAVLASNSDLVKSAVVCIDKRMLGFQRLVLT